MITPILDVFEKNDDPETRKRTMEWETDLKEWKTKTTQKLQEHKSEIARLHSLIKSFDERKDKILARQVASCNQRRSFRVVKGLVKHIKLIKDSAAVAGTFLDYDIPAFKFKIMTVDETVQVLDSVALTVPSFFPKSSSKTKNNFLETLSNCKRLIRDTEQTIDAFIVVSRMVIAVHQSSGSKEEASCPKMQEALTIAAVRGEEMLSDLRIQISTLSEVFLDKKKIEILKKDPELIIKKWNLMKEYLQKCVYSILEASDTLSREDVLVNTYFSGKQFSGQDLLNWGSENGKEICSRMPKRKVIIENFQLTFYLRFEEIVDFVCYLNVMTDKEGVVVVLLNQDDGILPFLAHTFDSLQDPVRLEFFTTLDWMYDPEEFDNSRVSFSFLSVLGEKAKYLSSRDTVDFSTLAVVGMKGITCAKESIFKQIKTAENVRAYFSTPTATAVDSKEAAFHSYYVRNFAKRMEISVIADDNRVGNNDFLSFLLSKKEVFMLYMAAFTHMQYDIQYYEAKVKSRDLRMHDCANLLQLLKDLAGAVITFRKNMQFMFARDTLEAAVQDKQTKINQLKVDLSEFFCFSESRMFSKKIHIPLLSWNNFYRISNRSVGRTLWKDSTHIKFFRYDDEGRIFYHYHTHENGCNHCMALSNFLPDFSSYEEIVKPSILLVDTEKWFLFAQSYCNMMDVNICEFLHLEETCVQEWYFKSLPHCFSRQMTRLIRSRIYHAFQGLKVSKGSSKVLERMPLFSIKNVTVSLKMFLAQMQNDDSNATLDFVLPKFPDVVTRKNCYFCNVFTAHVRSHLMLLLRKFLDESFFLRSEGLSRSFIEVELSEHENLTAEVRGLACRLLLCNSDQDYESLRSIIEIGEGDFFSLKFEEHRGMIDVLHARLSFLRFGVPASDNCRSSVSFLDNYTKKLQEKTSEFEKKMVIVPVAVLEPVCMNFCAVSVACVGTCSLSGRSIKENESMYTILCDQKCLLRLCHEKMFEVFPEIIRSSKQKNSQKSLEKFLQLKKRCPGTNCHGHLRGLKINVDGAVVRIGDTNHKNSKISHERTVENGKGMQSLPCRDEVKKHVHDTDDSCTTGENLKGKPSLKPSLPTAACNEMLREDEESCTTGENLEEKIIMLTAPCMEIHRDDEDIFAAFRSHKNLNETLNISEEAGMDIDPAPAQTEERRGCMHVLVDAPVFVPRSHTSTTGAACKTDTVLSSHHDRSKEIMSVVVDAPAFLPRQDYDFETTLQDMLRACHLQDEYTNLFSDVNRDFRYLRTLLLSHGKIRLEIELQEMGVHNQWHRTSMIRFFDNCISGSFCCDNKKCDFTTRNAPEG